jgi:hypothetical protein
MSTEQEQEHQHDWEKIGKCTHPHATGVQDGDAFRCKNGCGRYAHKITTFACGARRRKGEAIPPTYCPGRNYESWEEWWRETGEPAERARREKIAALRASGEID